MDKKIINTGFTLLELMLVIGIIAGLVALILPKMNNFQKYQRLDDAAGQLQSHIRLAQNQALSGIKCTSGARASQWSLVLNNATSYKIVPQCADGTSTPVTIYSLPGGIQMSSLEVITISDNCTDSSQAFSGYAFTFSNIAATTSFTIPAVSPCIGYAASPIRSFQLTLNLSALPTETASITIQNGGGVYVNQ